LALSLTPALLLLAAARAEACTCGGSGTPCEAYGRSAAVFVGTVTDIKDRMRTAPARGEEIGWAPRTVTFTVKETFSGVEGASVQVSTGMGGGDCGFNFVKGATYLVYAYGAGSGERRRLSTGICTRTQLAFGATEDLEYLRGLAGSPPGVTVSGRVERPGEGVEENGAPKTIGLAGIRITVDGGGERRELVTDAQGRYKLSGLGAGKYKVAVHPPDELTVYQPEREFELADRGCAVMNFYLMDNGRVGGRVLDAAGKPVAGVNVTVVDAESKHPEFKYGRHASTDGEGRYKFEGLPPGRYLLGLHVVAGFSQPNDPANAYARTYYPGVARAEEAEAIELKAGEELKARDLRLPPRRAESVIRGRVTWADGTPVVNAVVGYRDVTYTDPQINHAVNADERGEFTLKGYVGGVYRIEARSNRTFQGDVQRDGPMEEAPVLTITTTSPIETVTIVIKKLR
jgi:5-hydroxyisourate hydrolase-like protein (transthyretin family)